MELSLRLGESRMNWSWSLGWNSQTSFGFSSLQWRRNDARSVLLCDAASGKVETGQTANSPKEAL